MDETGDKEAKGPIKALLSDKYVHYKRVAQILYALSRYGFGRLGDEAARVKDLTGSTDETELMAGERAAVRFRLLLENLGPTFIKLGQMLSTRPDLIAEEYARELGNLRDDAPTISFEEARAVVEAELGAKLEDIFETFEETPVAAASIGQVHRAVVRETDALVAVKVQRPDIDDVIRADVEILRDMANTLRRTFRSIERFDPVGVVEEFGHMIRREIDYTVEARNIQRFRENLGSLPGIHVPAVLFDLSTRRVLTMEFVDGVSMDKVGKPGGPKADPGKLVSALGMAYVKQIFVDGFFHADPHQGNLFVGPGGEVTFLDFGAVGFMEEDAREMATEMYMAFMRGDEAKAGQALVRICEASTRDADMKRLAWDLRDYIDFKVLRSKGVDMGKGMNQSFVTIALKHGLMLPSSFVLLERTLLQIEGVAKGLDDEFDIIDLAKQNLPMLLKERLRPKREPLQAIETARDYADFMRDLPDRLDRVMDKLENDDISVKVEMPVLDDIRRQIRKAGLMVSASLIALALIFYVAWAGTSVDIPIGQLTLTIPIIIAIWLGAMVLIHRRV
jgi:ubiquinone biosynthesis protein